MRLFTSISQPTRKEKFIILCFLIYFLAEVSHDSYTADLDLLRLSHSQSVIEYYLRVIRDASLSCAIATMIIGGIRKARREGVSVRTLILPGIGALLCVMHFGVTAWFWQKDVERIHEEFNAENQRVEKIEGRIAELMNNPKENSRAMQCLAGTRYLIDGKRTEYPDENGALVLFKPSEQERNLYERKRKTNILSERMNAGLKRGACLWISLLVISIVLGLVTPVKKNGTINTTTEAT